MSTGIHQQPASVTMRARIGAYAVWQAWDFVRDRGWGVLLIGLLVGGPIVFFSQEAMSIGAGDPAAQLASMLMERVVAPYLPLFVLLAINRIVSADRKMGYYRLLFSKPLSIATFYAQRFAVHLAGLAACVFILCVLVRMGGVPITVGGIVVYTIILYIAMGGVGFLLSIVTRFDWPALLGAWYGASVLHTIVNFRWPSWEPAIRVLPPSWLVDEVRNTLLRGDVPSFGTLTWLLGYGIGCCVLGLFLLRRQALAR
jgi:hypothetical protein